MAHHWECPGPVSSSVYSDKFCFHRLLTDVTNKAVAVVYNQIHSGNTEKNKHMSLMQNFLKLEIYHCSYESLREGGSMSCSQTDWTEAPLFSECLMELMTKGRYLGRTGDSSCSVSSWQRHLSQEDFMMTHADDITLLVRKWP